MQLLKGPLLMVQKTGHQQMKAPVNSRPLRVHFRRSREKCALSLVVVKQVSLAKIVGISFTYPLWQLVVANGAYGVTCKLVGDYMSNEVIERSVYHNGLSIRRDKVFFLDHRVT